MKGMLSKAHRLLGGLILGGSADALGWRNESAKKHARRKTIERLEGWTKRIGRIGGYWESIQPGEYSDDTQLTLAVARCINGGAYDANRFLHIELPYWLSYERGGGRTVRAAARNALKSPAVSCFSNVFPGYYESGANGAAMRVFPFVAIDDIRDFQYAVWQNVLSTHGHPRAIWGALTMAYSLHTLYRHPELAPEALFKQLTDFIDCAEPPADSAVEQWVERAGRERFLDSFRRTRSEMKTFLTKAFRPNADNDNRVLEELGCFEQRTKGSGTACVAAAHFFFQKYRDSPVKAVIEAANTLGTDTDTIAKLAGDLLGCVYGRAAYENTLTENVKNRFYFLYIVRCLLGKEEPHWLGLENRETDITKDLREGDEYYSRVFGVGVIVSKSLPKVIRRGAATLHQAQVDFECGMSCVFSKLEPRTSTEPNRLWTELE